MKYYGIQEQDKRLYLVVYDNKLNDMPLIEFKTQREAIKWFKTQCKNVVTLSNIQLIPDLDSNSDDMTKDINLKTKLDKV